MEHHVIDHQIRIHPIWKEAALAIADRVNDEGYGFLITWEELLSMLEIDEFQDVMAVEDMKKIQFDKLEKVFNLYRELLYEHSIMLYNIRNKGYKVLVPDDQVSKGYNKSWRNVRKGLKKCIDVLTHVDETMLSEQGMMAKDRNLNKTVFVMKAASKRKIPNRVKIENDKDSE